MTEELRGMRRMPNLRESRAALILELLKIPHEYAKQMTISQIEQLVSDDHYPVAWNTARDLGWTSEQVNHPSNIMHPVAMQHLAKSRKIDTPQAAKGKRLHRKNQEHLARIRRTVEVTEGGLDAEQHQPKTRPRSRPIPGSRASGWRKPMNGPAERR